MSTTTTSEKKKNNRGFYKNKKQTTSSASEAKPEEKREEEKTADKSAPKPEPKPDLKKGPPVPRHLATKQTPLKNDPIYVDSFVIDGDRGFIPAPRARFFSPSCDSFIPLIHADYYNLVSANRSFGKTFDKLISGTKMEEDDKVKMPFIVYNF